MSSWDQVREEENVATVAVFNSDDNKVAIASCWDASGAENWGIVFCLKEDFRSSLLWVFSGWEIEYGKFRKYWVKNEFITSKINETKWK